MEKELTKEKKNAIKEIEKLIAEKTQKISKLNYEKTQLLASVCLLKDLGNEKCKN